MNNLLIEIKHEYTTILVNIIAPLIYEGIKNIYNSVCKGVNSNGNDTLILQLFQESLQKITKWDNNIIIQEVNRIKQNTKSSEWLHNLIKGTLKANISIFNYNSSNVYENITIEQVDNL